MPKVTATGGGTNNTDNIPYLSGAQIGARVHDMYYARKTTYTMPCLDFQIAEDNRREE